MNKLIVIVVVAVIGIAAYYLMTNKTPTSPLDSASSTFSLPNQNSNQSTPQPPQPTIQPATPTPPATTGQTEATVMGLIKAKTAVIKTSKGDIELMLYLDGAPNTVSNFARKAKSGFYNNLAFHRVEDWVIQGGDPLGNGTGGGNMPVEFNNKPFVTGSLGVASRGDNIVQNDAQFFITKKDSEFLNGKYTNFGIVTKGMDVVEKIEVGDKILGITTE